MEILKQTHTHSYLLMCLIGLRFFGPSVRDVVTKNKKHSIFRAAAQTCGQGEEGVCSTAGKGRAKECRLNTAALFGEARAKPPGGSSYRERLQGHAGPAL